VRIRPWQVYLAGGIPLTVLYFSLPADTAKLVVWPVIGWSSVIAILIGVRVNRPEAPLAWYLLAAGVGTFIVGDNLYSFRNFVQHSATLFPSYVDIIYLAVYLLLIAGLALLLHRRTAGRDRAGVIDAAIVTASLGLVSWVLLIAPYVRFEGLTVLERLVSIAYPVGDVALLAIAARLAVGAGRRSVAFWLLVGGLVPLLAADALYGYLNLAGTWHEHNPVDVGWIAFYMCWGAAALHPSMRELSMPTATTRRISPTRLLVIGSAVLVPPAMLFIQDFRGAVTDATAIAVVSAFLFALVVVRIAGLARDAADERSEARFRTLVDNASDAVVVLDAEGRVRYRTPSTERVLGRRGSELDGAKLSDLLEAADKERLLVMLSNESATTTVEWRFRRDDGLWRDLEVVAADMRSTVEVDGLVLTMRDITERKHLDFELGRQALHDSLTGLPNRTLFLDRLEQALQRAERTDASIAVVLFDLDDFKEVNDSLGHSAGDDLLVAVATRLTTSMHPGVTVARLGGDEFALLVDDGDMGAALERTALRIQSSLRAPFLLRDEEVSVRVSIGMAIGSPSTHTADDVLRNADLAMYVAKRNGKDRFEKYLPAMHEEASRRLVVAAELRGAIERGELVVFYQPIVDLSSERTLGVEALVRWNHPHRGLLGPNEFIPVAETTGVIIPLGRWVLNEACRQTAAWKAAGIADDSFYVSVNLSARQVQDDNILDDVGEALEGSGLAARALVLEITETALIEDLNPAGVTLATLRHLGLRIAVDDFGTGYSSLAHLSNFPLDIIKLDKSFVDRVASSAEGERMVRAVVDLGRTLGLIAIAEGVEQALALEHLGCEFAQGFLFARPMPASEMSALLERQAGLFVERH
jgi:diguanylate cyclase (GGDEF)-like protein/PAS domain S-box-containing protein